MTRAIITVVGKDTVGIIAKVCTYLAENNVNILDITQTIMGDIFSMIMLVDVTGMTSDFSELVDDMTSLGEKLGLSIHTMHEDIFNTMHRI